MTERPMTEDDDAPVDAFRVFMNALSGSIILLSIAMAVFGFVYKDDCSSEPRLSTSLTIQGFINITMPIWFLLKWRLLLPITKTIFLSVFIGLYVIHFSSLVACTVFLSFSSGCDETELYKTTYALVVAVWIITFLFMTCAPLVKLFRDDAKPKPENDNNRSRS